VTNHDKYEKFQEKYYHVGGEEMCNLYELFQVCRNVKKAKFLLCV